MGLRIVAKEPDDFRARVVIPLPPRLGSPDSDRWRSAVDVVIPVHNQEMALEPGVRQLHAFLLTGFPFTARITIADDGQLRPRFDRSNPRRLASKNQGGNGCADPVAAAGRGAR